MAVCEKHGRFFKDNEFCGACWAAGSLAKKVESKATASKPSGLKRLKDKAQALHSKKIKAIYCKEKFTNCWTCGKPVLTKGTSVVNTIHCGHYFPKGTYWELAYLLENSGLQCYDCNCNNQGVIPAMRIKLVSIFGESVISKLDKLADKFINEKRAGIKKSQPPEMWLIGQIELLKRELKVVK